MERFLWICLAGAAGTGARYLIALWAAQRFGSSFPFGTLIVNLVGCFAIAAVMHAASTLSWSPTCVGHHHRLHRWPNDVFEFQLRNDSTDGGRRDGRGSLQRNRHDRGRVRCRLVRDGLRAAVHRPVRRL